eukprot:10822178-Karenia_brevis.AAC.1
MSSCCPHCARIGIQHSVGRHGGMMVFSFSKTRYSKSTKAKNTSKNENRCKYGLITSRSAH